MKKSIEICSLLSVLKSLFAPNCTIHNYYTADFEIFESLFAPKWTLKRFKSLFAPECNQKKSTKKKCNQKKMAPNCTYTMTRQLVFEMLSGFVGRESVWK